MPTELFQENVPITDELAAFPPSRSWNSPTHFGFCHWRALASHCWRVSVGTSAMPNEEIATSGVGPTIEEIKQEIEDLADSAMAPVQSAALDLQENAQSAVVQVKDAVASAVDTFVHRDLDWAIVINMAATSPLASC